MAEKAVTTKPANAASIFKKRLDTGSVIDKADILIPKLLLMQGLSDLVTDDKAKMGDIANSVTGKIVGGNGKKVSFIPLLTNKSWVRYQKEDGGALKYLGNEPWTAKNSGRQWEEVTREGTFRNDACLNFYVLLEEDMTNPKALPYLLSFRRTSYRSGRKLVNHFMEADMAQLAPYSGMMFLDSTKEKNDSGVYYIFDVMPNTDTPEKYADKINEWVEVLSKGAHQVDESDLEENAKPVTPPATAKTTEGVRAF